MQWCVLQRPWAALFIWIRMLWRLRFGGQGRGCHLNCLFSCDCLLQSRPGYYCCLQVCVPKCHWLGMQCDRNLRSPCCKASCFGSSKFWTKPSHWKLYLCILSSRFNKYLVTSRWRSMELQYIHCAEDRHKMKTAAALTQAKSAMLIQNAAMATCVQICMEKRLHHWRRFANRNAELLDSRALMNQNAVVEAQ